MEFIAENSTEGGPVLTAESFEASLKTLMRMSRIPEPILVTNKAVKEALDEVARTKTIKTIGNYRLRELDGKRWWSRGWPDPMDQYGTFPRDRGEGWTSWFHFNRHWRKRGFPAVCDYQELKRLVPRARA